MSQINRAEAERRLKLIENALREGHPPPGQGGNARGAIRVAGEADGCARSSCASWYQSAVRSAGRDVDWDLYSPPEPEGRADFEGAAPDGFNLKGRSTLYRGDGSILQEWVKTDLDRGRQLELFREAIEALTTTLPRSRPVAGPKTADSDRLAVYPVGDHHFGMYAWGRETGDADYNLETAEQLLVSAFDTLVRTTVRCEQAVIAILGDFFHYDSFEPVTTKSRNLLDSDTRYPKMVEVATRAVRYLIREAAKRHKNVHVIVTRGNHDPGSSYFLANSLSNIYEDDPRITIDLEPTSTHYYRFGEVLLGITHGDTVKMRDLPLIMAADRPEDWGATTARYWLTGHIHHDSKQEHAGVVCESFRVLAPKDAWHAEQGYRSGRSMKAIVYHRQLGEIERHTFNPRMLEVGDDDE